jgi:predicted transcriptional regulator
MAREPRARGSLEEEVLSCLAANGGPMTAAQVQTEIGGLAYTTVMTTLSRLYTKGALARQPVGRAYEYALIGDPSRARSNMTAHQMLKLLDEESDRAGVLTRFVNELSDEDEQLLTALLEKGEPPAKIGRSTTGHASRKAPK